MLRRISILLIGLAITWATLAIAANTKKSTPSISTPAASPHANTAAGSDVAQPEPAPAASVPSTMNSTTITPTNITVDGREVLNPDWPTDQPYEFSTPAMTLSGAQGTASAPVNMDWYSVNNGGATEVAAGNIKLGVSVGQNAVGEVAAGNVKLGLGFWYGAGTAAPCACQCAHDPQCDGHPDIIDVTQCINVAFRDGAPILDPSATCPYATTDVDCTNATDILDVTKMINVAFRDGSPAVNFCNPCP